MSDLNKPSLSRPLFRPLFRPATRKTLDLIAEFNRKQKHTFLIPTKFISAEAGQVGFLLDAYINSGRAPAEQQLYRTFYANSRYEALQGAIKLARHAAEALVPQTLAAQRRTLIYEADATLRKLFDPLQKGPAEALAPGIEIYTDLAEMAAQLQVDVGNDVGSNADIISAVFCANADTDAETDLLSKLLQMCRDRNIISIFCDWEMRPGIDQQRLHALNLLPDLFVTGESLTDYEIPFGSFSMTEAVHRPWVGLMECFIHSSTYAGNTLTLTRVRDVLLNATNAAERSQLQQRCAEIAGSDSARRDAFARYINPGLVEMYLLTGLDLNPRKAVGACLTLGTEGDSANERIIFDCVTGGGAVARGHNPTDLLPEVLACHEAQHDYWAELSAELATFTLQHAFPAVSGATAVDIGISLACLANPLRRKIVVFNRNYAGKTLISLIATRCDECNAPFGPLYRQRVDIDPWSAQAEDELTAVLTSGEVALVWFEFIQGDTRRQIPATLIEIINRHKAAHGYFTGVDEILMGFYRSGPLLSHLGSVPAPDIITLAKPLSDGVFPIAATLVSDALYQQAQATQPATVAFLATLYRNQLGAHVALHAIRKIRAADFQVNLNHTSAILAQGLPQLVPQLPLLKEISGQGMIYHLAYRPLCPARPEWDAFLVFFMCRFFLEHAGVILFFDGFTPPLNLKPDEAEAILQRMSNAITTHGGEIGARFQAYLCEVFGYNKDDQDIHAQLAEAMRVIEGRP